MTSVATPTPGRDPALPPLPACGERVGVRGPVRALKLAERPPHPARQSAPTSPRTRGEVAASGPLRNIVALLMVLILVGVTEKTPAQPAPSSPAGAPPAAAAAPRQRIVIGYVDIEGDPRYEP